MPYVPPHLPVSVQGLIPHRPPVAMEGTLLQIIDHGGVLEIAPSADSLFVNPETGYLETEALMEFAAQAAAAVDTYRRGIILDGMLVEINRFQSEFPVRYSEKIMLSIHEEYGVPPWHILSFQIATPRGTAAEGELKLCVPE